MTSTKRTYTDANLAEESDGEDNKHAKLIREELEGLKYWVEKGCRVATDLIRIALYAPIVFTSVENFESKLYTAITNVIWVNEMEGVACLMSWRLASDLAAFIDSMVGEKKRKTYRDGPYLGAPTGEDLAPDKENEMHALLRGLGFDKIDFDAHDKYFLTALKNTYKCDFAHEFGDPPAHSFETEREVWEAAVKKWAGEEPEK
jgi:hypothetical protein